VTPSAAAADWTLSTLHVYLLRIIEDHVLAITARMDAASATTSKETELVATAITTALAASDKAIVKAEIATEKRFDVMVAYTDKQFDALKVSTEKRFDVIADNTAKRFDVANGFRGAMEDQAKTFAPRTEIMNNISNLAEKLDLLGARVDKNEGAKQGVDAVWVYALGFATLISAIVAVVALFVKH
jgi:hypothetical protein